MRRCSDTLRIAVLVLLLFASVNHANAGLLTPDRPNVVLICLDTVRYDTYWLPESANLDDPLRAWHARGVRLREVQSAAPWTVPSVASVMTGQYPLHHNGGRFAAEVANLDKMVPSPLSRQILTFPQMMMRYDSAAFISNPFLLAQSGVLRVPVLQYLKKSEEVNQAARAFIDRHVNGRRPFFLYLHYMDAHGASVATVDQAKASIATADAAAVRQIRRRAPAAICDGDPDREQCLRYVMHATETLRMRGYVAGVLQQLEDREMLGNTAVIVFSDHGEEFSEHIAEEKALHKDPREYYGAGHGQSLYQELLHVPVVVWYPKWKSADVNTPLSLVDVAPTIVDWTGAGAAMKSDGVVWADPKTLNEPSDQDRILFSSGISYGPEQVAARLGPWVRIIRDPSDRLLFSLRRDPQQKTPFKVDVAFRTVDDEIFRYAARSSGADLQPAKASRELLKELQSLGYLSGGH